MKSILLFHIVVCFSLSCFGQEIVSIPDSNFLKALIKNNVDENNNGKIETSEAEKVISLNVENSLIKDMTGLQSFILLNELNCNMNQIKSLDLSKNTLLEYLYSDDNELSTIDVSHNTMLLHLHCANNNISKIDLSKNEKFVHLYCHNNSIDSLDFSINKKLRKLEANNNRLRILDFRFHPDLYGVLVYNNPDLKQICIKNEQYNKIIAKPEDWVKDDNANWSLNCITGLDDDLPFTGSNKIERIYNSLGQELKIGDAKNGLFICQYSDGSIKKIMLSE